MLSVVKILSLVIASNCHENLKLQKNNELKKIIITKTRTVQNEKYYFKKLFGMSFKTFVRLIFHLLSVG